MAGRGRIFEIDRKKPKQTSQTLLRGLKILELTASGKTGGVHEGGPREKVAITGRVRLEALRRKGANGDIARSIRAAIRKVGGVIGKKYWTAHRNQNKGQSLY